MLWVFANSLRSSKEIFENPFGAPWVLTGSPYAEEPGEPDPWDSAKANFANAWVTSHFGTFFLNSVLVTAVSLVGILAVSSMAAYPPSPGPASSPQPSSTSSAFGTSIFSPSYS
jgi:N-acetylglucosamine transport system permease protein